LDGNYLHSKKHPDNNPGFERYACEFNDSLFVSYRECEETGCPDIIFSDRETLQTKQSIKSDPLFTEFTPSLPIDRDENTVFYYSRNDTVYDISSHIGQLVPICTVDMGKKHRKFKSSFSAAKNQEETVQLFLKAFQEQKIKLIRGFFCNKQYFAVNYLEFNPDVEHGTLPGVSFFNHTVFYDRETKKSYKTNYINFDVINSLKIQKMPLQGSSDGYFYAVINEYFEKETLEAIAKSPYLPEDTKKAILDMDEMSNPLILVFK
jgi:hypothetical protein